MLALLGFREQERERGGGLYVLTYALVSREGGGDSLSLSLFPKGLCREEGG